MNILLINDTSNSPNLGCQANMSNIKKVLKLEYPSAIVHFAYRKHLSYTNINRGQYDIAIVNGEGSITHCNEVYNAILKCIAADIPVHIVNFSFAVKKNIDIHKYVNLFKRCESVCVRDPVSYYVLQNLGVDSIKLFPDMVINNSSNTANRTNSIIITGGSFMKYKKYASDKMINAFDKLIKHIKKDYKIIVVEWKMESAIKKCFLEKELKRLNRELDYISTDFLSFSKLCSESVLCMSGAHHGNIMSFAAHTPFITWKANMWKTDGDSELYNMPFLDIDKFMEDVNYGIDTVSSALVNNDSIKNATTKRFNELQPFFKGHIQNTKNSQNDIIANKLYKIDSDKLNKIIKRYQ
jgi:polysaccharide pyruvyl transferase WcaK-like protein